MKSQNHKNNLSLSVVTVFLFGILILNIVPIHAEPVMMNTKLVSPLQQFNSGVKLDKIQCVQGLELIIKSNDAPACVKPSSAIKLVQWGWAKTIFNAIQNPNENESSDNIITLDSNDKSITLNSGERFVLKLGDNFNWDISIDDDSIISRVINIMTIRGSQGVYESHNVGTAELTAVGNPICLDTPPYCKMHSILFKLHVTVLSSETDLSNLKVLTDNDEFQKGDPINITINNQGSTRLFPIGWGYSIADSQGNHVAPNGVLRMMIAALPTGESIQWTWDQTDINGTQVISGKYKIIGTYTEETGKEISSFKEIIIK